MFQNWYVEKDAEQIDVMNGGEYSCAFFVSTITTIFDLSQRPHATVKSTLEDLQESAWKEVDEFVEGAILLWEEENGHFHIGFYIGNDRAISNSTINKVPKEHDVNFDGTRKVLKIFVNDKLN